MNNKDKLAETKFDSVGEMMAAYAEEAVRAAWREHRKILDMRESPVAVLEAILQDQAASDLDYQSRLWGSYFGEVLRSQFGGEWEFSDYPGLLAAIPALILGESRLFPTVKIYRRLTMGESESLTAFYEMVSSRFKKVRPA